MTVNLKIGYGYSHKPLTSCSKKCPALAPRLAVVLAFVCAAVLPVYAADTATVTVRAFGFQAAQDFIPAGASNRTEIKLVDSSAVAPPFNQSAVKQGTEAALIGPDPAKPYFTVRFAMPIPPENLTNNFAAFTGLGQEVFTRNHSPGFEILPNGDA